MTTFKIHEANLERLEKKLAKVEKKCAQSHCNFHYEITGEEYKEIEDERGNKYTAKYYVVDVDGTSKYEGWEFVATIDHHDAGNVLRAYKTDLVIPDKYKTCGPRCEHCNKIRSRKDTYLIYNAEADEFKQVGKSCLQEFTHGLSAEDVAFFCSIYEKFEAAGGYSGTSYNRYTSVRNILRFAFECYRHWGYQKSSTSFAEDNGFLPVGYRSTRDRATDYYYIDRCLQQERDRLRAEMDEVGFNADSDYAVETTEAALEWIRNEEPDNEYIRNLKVICSDEYTDWRSLGILVSLTTAYERHLGKIAAYEAKQKEQEEETAKSEYVGEKGKRITISCASSSCISSWDGIYGMTYLYKFTDMDSNVFIWYASKALKNAERVATLVGTVKNHSEYNGTKQTVLTRCKATEYFPEEPEEVPEDSVLSAVESFYKTVER